MRAGQGLSEKFQRCVPIVGRARAVVHAVGNTIEFVLTEHAEIRALGQVLPKHPIALMFINVSLHNLLGAWRETSFYSERERAALVWTESVRTSPTTTCQITSRPRLASTSAKRNWWT